MEGRDSGEGFIWERNERRFNLVKGREKVVDKLGKKSKIIKHIIMEIVILLHLKSSCNIRI